MRPVRRFVPILVLGSLALGGTALAPRADAVPARGAVAGTVAEAPEIVHAAPDKPTGQVSVSPQPGENYASAKTEISFRGVSAKGLAKGLVVAGSKSGRHAGRIAAHADGGGASFVTGKAFTPGETVTVSTPLTIAGARKKGSFTFRIAVPATIAINLLGQAPGNLHRATFHSEPTLHPEVPTVTGTALYPGDLFSAPYGNNLGGEEIDDPAGNLVWYQPSDKFVAGFRTQTWHGQPVLTWWEGDVVLPGYGHGVFVIADTSYHVLATFSPGDGYIGDVHEFQLTPQGTALIEAYTPVSLNTTSAGGTADGAVLDNVMQEIEPSTGRVVYEWHTLDHVKLTDGYDVSPKDGTVWDPYHMNSVQEYGAAKVVMSFRGTHQIVIINRSTGAVQVTIGGKHPSIADPADADTYAQHDAEIHADGTLSILDNGGTPGPAPHAASRGLILKLTPTGVSVLKVLPAPAGTPVSSGQGNLQVLAGAYLADYGSTGAIVLYDAAGNITRYTQYDPRVLSYRTTVAAWHATPTTVPATANAVSGTTSTTWVSWNGATEVASWKVFAGADAAHLVPVTTVAKDGFETAIQLPVVTGVEQVQALDANGNVLASSAPATVGG